MSFNFIESYGLISNQRTAALISENGSIDLYCPEGFDSPTVFARLLDDNGGYFKICHCDQEAVGRNLYFPDSNVLISRFGREGVCETWNFFASTSALGKNALIRKVKGITGRSRLTVDLQPRFDYGRRNHRIEKADGGFRLVPQGDGPSLFFYSDVGDLEIAESRVYGEIELSRREVRHFVLTDQALDVEVLKNLAEREEFELNYTTRRTRQWVNHSSYSGRWQDEVNRSALALQMNISLDHGAMVAAPSFSLPEVPGDRFNWDYRYAWIRDNSLAFQSLMLLGLNQDVKNYMRWLRPLLHRHAGENALQPVYGLDQRENLEETTLDHWSGYDGSSPVRIGNSAYQQLQLDVYGELMRFLDFYDKKVERLCHEDLLAIRRLLGWLSGHWREKGHSIWEERDGRHQYLYSKVMAWVALKKGIDLFERRAVPADLELWRENRDAIYRYVHENFWHQDGSYFQRTTEDPRVDASALVMPLVDFISITDPRWQSTMTKIEDELLDDCLVHRFRFTQRERTKGHKVEEGTFCLCTFWYANCLAKAERTEDARYIFERMLGFANHLGLYSEELGLDGSHLGNFPLSLTHSALISTALSLDQALRKGKVESEESLTGRKELSYEDKVPTR